MNILALPFVLSIILYVIYKYNNLLSSFGYEANMGFHSNGTWSNRSLDLNGTTIPPYLETIPPHLETIPPHLETIPPYLETIPPYLETTAFRKKTLRPRLRPTRPPKHCNPKQTGSPILYPAQRHEEVVRELEKCGIDVKDYELHKLPWGARQDKAIADAKKHLDAVREIVHAEDVLSEHPNSFSFLKPPFDSLDVVERKLSDARFAVAFLRDIKEELADVSKRLEDGFGVDVDVYDVTDKPWGELMQIATTAEKHLQTLEKLRSVVKKLRKHGVDVSGLDPRGLGYNESRRKLKEAFAILMSREEVLKEVREETKRLKKKLVWCKKNPVDFSPQDDSLAALYQVRLEIIVELRHCLLKKKDAFGVDEDDSDVLLGAS
jgi:hypothetical protein